MCRTAAFLAALPTMSFSFVYFSQMAFAGQDAGFAPVPAVRPSVPQPMAPQATWPAAPNFAAPPVAPSPADPAGSPVMVAPLQVAPGMTMQTAPEAGVTVRQGVPVATTNLDGLAPPPGTLGTTYKRRSRLVPDDKHPRTGIVDLWNVPESADISARGLKPRWYNDHWRLESEVPLIPGLPHIYGIQVIKEVDGQKTTDVKWVRLIMGRIVDLEF